MLLFLSEAHAGVKLSLNGPVLRTNKRFSSRKSCCLLCCVTDFSAKLPTWNLERRSLHGRLCPRYLINYMWLKNRICQVEIVSSFRYSMAHKRWCKTVFNLFPRNLKYIQNKYFAAYCLFLDKDPDKKAQTSSLNVPASIWSSKM